MQPWQGLYWLLGLTALPVVAAQSSLVSALNQIPDCALGCFETAIPKSACSITNETCLCTDQPLTTEVRVCVRGACTVTEALYTQNLTMSLCGFPIRDKSEGYQTLTIVLLVISSLCVLQRVIHKYVLKIGLGADDWVILFTLASVIANSIFHIRGLIRSGFGRDMYTLTPSEITRFLKYFQVSAILYFTQITFLKISLLLFYLRIFPTPSVRILLWGTVIFSALFGIAYTLVTIFVCYPISYFWDQWDGEHQGKCANLTAISVSNAVISIVMDIWMLAIPLSQLRTLNLDWKKKIGVGMMFCVGTFVTIVSILRFRSVLAFGSNNENPTWDYLPVARWSLLEIDIGIICACMPAIRMLFAHFFASTFGTIRRTIDGSGISSDRPIRSKRSGKTSHMSVEVHHRQSVPSNRLSRPSIFSPSSPSIDELQLVELREVDGKSSISEPSVR